MAKKKRRSTLTEQTLKIIRKSKQKEIVKLKEIREIDSFLASLMKEIPEIDEDADPLYKRYIHVHNFIGVIIDLLIGLKPCQRFQRVHDEADDIYMPSGPPTSSITTSLFQHWFFYDLALGVSKESLGQIVLGALKFILPMFNGFEELQTLIESRLGFYFVTKKDSGDLFLVEEKRTKQKHWIKTASGYEPQVGEILLGRLFSLEGFDYSIMTTTPYVLGGLVKPPEGLSVLHQTMNLESFLKRALTEHQMDYETLMKEGPSRFYWLEYIFQAFSGFNPSSIVLFGYPDIPESMPHSEVSRDNRDLFLQYYEKQSNTETYKNTKGRKGSEIILEFMRPWLDKLRIENDITEIRIKQLISVGVIIWNMEVFQERKDEVDADTFQEMERELNQFFTVDAGVQSLVLDLKDRKNTFFKEHNFIVQDYFLRYDQKDDDMKLSVQFY